MAGVLAAAARHGSAAAVEAAEQRFGGNGGVLAMFYSTLVICCAALVGLIWRAGKLPQLSDADALKCGTVVSLAVRASPGKLALQ